MAITEMILRYLAVFILQFFFNISKVLEIKYTYEKKIPQLLTNTIWINLLSLGSIYFSLASMFKGDWLIIIVYIAGGVFGKWFAMTHLEKYKYKIFTFLRIDFIIRNNDKIQS